MNYWKESNELENQQEPPKPVNLYIGDHFTVRLDSSIEVRSVLTELNKSSLLHCRLEISNSYDIRQSLSAGAQNMMAAANAGGSSIISEALSFEMFHRCFEACFYKAEMDVLYQENRGPKTDYVCLIYDIKMGVSVTRLFRGVGVCTFDYACKLLKKKLQGIVQSSKNSLENWSKQILHIWTLDQSTADFVSKAYSQMHNDNDLISNTLIVVTTLKSSFIYNNRWE